MGERLAEIKAKDESEGSGVVAQITQKKELISERENNPGKPGIWHGVCTGDARIVLTVWVLTLRIIVNFRRISYCFYLLSDLLYALFCDDLA
jgi:hypothetical protein